MTYDEWVKTYRPIKNPTADYGFDQALFETFGPDIEQVRATDPACVWTYHDEDGVSWIGDGYHVVNRLGHFITEVPAPSDQFIEVNLDD
jgi:hypothetical protein